MIEEVYELYEHYKFVVPEGQSLVRIDRYLTYKIQNSTRHKVQMGIEKGYVLVNDLPVKNNYRVKPNDVIKIKLPEKVKDKTHYPENMNLNILYEDDFLLIINKPAGIVVHPTFNNYEGTLYNGLLYHFEKNLHSEKPYIVHRIDKDTSGILIVAKDIETMKNLAQQFFYHSVKRTYYALVWGKLENKSGTIKTFLDRSKKDRKLVQVYKNEGKEAITHYEVIKEYNFFSLIKCNLETGRTHQIRVHLSHLGNPIFNDSFYGGDVIPKEYANFLNEDIFYILQRHALHSKDIIFYHPVLKKNIFVESELPDDFKNMISMLD